MEDWWRSITLFFGGFLFTCNPRFANQHELLFSKNKEIEDLEEAEGVDEKERDVPVALVVPRGFPEGQTLPENSPDSDEREPAPEALAEPAIVHHIAPVVVTPVPHHMFFLLKCLSTTSSLARF